MITLSDIDICARTVYGEARGETQLGRQAVAHVCVNRWRSNKGQFKRDTTLSKACQRRSQFSCWNPEDPNFETIQLVGFENRTFLECYQAVFEAILSDEDRLTENSTHYHATSITPYWVEGKAAVGTIGGHKFYNDIA